ncbi:hypothetical protein [Enterobacter ludwigii]|uniref:hypothetical protein n=1 Tax=Enterobacter ludwigii TaxID=299767 RepID=UPI003975EEEC
MSDKVFAEASIEHIAITIAIRMIASHMDDESRSLLKADIEKMESEIVSGVISESATDCFRRQIRSLKYLLNIR